jgi:hypothetical protein
MDPKLSKRLKIQKLLEYVEHNNVMEQLLDRVAQARPNEYRRFAQRFERGPSAGTRRHSRHSLSLHSLRARAYTGSFMHRAYAYSFRFWFRFKT